MAIQKNISILSILLFTFFGKSQAQKLHATVDPFIGTGAHGHTFPGATQPFGMVQLSPDTRIDGSWDGCSGYHFSDSIIYGFSHTHLSGTGCSDYGDISFMPYSFEDKPELDFEKFKKSGTSFSHQNENAHAGFYEVKLNDGLHVKLTSTARVGLQSYSPNKKGYVLVTLNMEHRDEVLESKIKQLNSRAFNGFRRSKAWAQNQNVYYQFELSQKPLEMLTLTTPETGESFLFLLFKVKANDEILIKTGLSSVDEIGAAKNIAAELPFWDFEKTKKQAEQNWEQQLSKIIIEANIPQEDTIFYTALYHTMIQPNIFNDVDHRYRGRDGKVHLADGFDYYTVFSLWDTYRATHPLYTIIEPKRTLDFIKTMLAQYEQVNRLPMWELWSNETNCMIGYHAVSVIADALAKGISDFDTVLAFEAAIAASQQKIFGIDKFHEKGYLEIEDESESVSKSLEYAYDDWCIAQMAKRRGDEELYKKYMAYANSAQNLMDFKTGFMRPRSNGGWLQPFDPREVNNHFTEANSWQYSFASSFNHYFRWENLDQLFNASIKTTGREQSDITGLIGQYAHGNEPSHHIAWLYAKYGDLQPTQNLIDKILDSFYTTGPEGLIGNEDCGQMSAWYVFSSMGFYPTNPGEAQYTIALPRFKKVQIKSGHHTTIITTTHTKLKPGFSPYFSFDNGSDEYRNSVSHHELLNAKTINIDLKNAPRTLVMPRNPIPENTTGAPIINSKSGQVFDAETTVQISKNGNNNAAVFYKIDEEDWQKYEQEFSIKKSSKITAFVGGRHADTNFSVAHFYKRPNNFSIKLNTDYSQQYSAGGANALIDGLNGSKHWRKGRWQGYQAQDLDAVIDMQKMRAVKSITVTFLEDQRAWIFAPKSVHFYMANDEKMWEEINIQNIENANDETIKIIPVQFAQMSEARYIRIVAENFGPLPEDHAGAGGEAFIFVDEIKIEL